MEHHPWQREVVVEDVVRRYGESPRVAGVGARQRWRLRDDDAFPSEYAATPCHASRPQCNGTTDRPQSSATSFFMPARLQKASSAGDASNREDGASSPPVMFAQTRHAGADIYSKQKREHRATPRRHVEGIRWTFALYNGKALFASRSACR